MTNINLTVTDKAASKWEMFLDRGYFDLWCVRCLGDRSFNSTHSFHFQSHQDALQFIKLIERSY